MKLATAKIDIVPTLNKGAMSNIQRKFKALRSFAGGAGGFFMKANQSMQLFQAVLNQALGVFNQVKGLTSVADEIGDSADAWGTTVDNALAVRKVFADAGLSQKDTEKMINKLIGKQKEGAFGADAVDLPVEQLLSKLAPQFGAEGGEKVFAKTFGARNLSMRGEFSNFSMDKLNKIKSDSGFKKQTEGVKNLAASQAKISQIEFESTLKQISISNRKGLNKAVEQGVSMQERTKQKALENSSVSQITQSVKTTEFIKQKIDQITSGVLELVSLATKFLDKLDPKKMEAVAKKERKQYNDMTGDPRLAGGLQ